MKQKIILSTFVVLILGGLGVGYWTIKQNPTEWRLLQARLGLLSEVEATGIYEVSGYIEATEVSIEAETTGRILMMLVDEGDYIERGQPLIQLDADLLKAEMQVAQSQVDTAQAELIRNAVARRRGPPV